MMIHDAPPSDAPKNPEVCEPIRGLPGLNDLVVSP